MRDLSSKVALTSQKSYNLNITQRKIIKLWEELNKNNNEKKTLNQKKAQRKILKIER